MAEFIDREVAKAKIREKFKFVPARIEINEVLNSIPRADVRPVVRGKWIDHQEGRWIYAKCSECGTVHDVRSNFCPNCGADMREES